MRLLSNYSVEMILRPSDLAINNKTVYEMLLPFMTSLMDLRIMRNCLKLKLLSMTNNIKGENNQSDLNCLYLVPKISKLILQLKISSLTMIQHYEEKKSNASHILSIEHFGKVVTPIINSIDARFLRSVRLSIDHSSRMGRFSSDAVFSSLIASEAETS